jgi:hypothetical protein
MSGIVKSAVGQPARARAVIGPSTPVMKIGGRLLPIARGSIGKGAPTTFAQAMASEAIGEWLPAGLVTLRQVVEAAVAGDPNDPTITGELRLEAVRGSLAEFGDALLVHVAAAIVGQAPAVVAKRKPSTWKGML